MFTTHRNYTSTLPQEKIAEQIQLLARHRGRIHALPGSRPFPAANYFSFRITSPQHNTSVSGTLYEAGNGCKLTVTYRPAINPLYWYIPLLVLFTVFLWTADGFTINKQPASYVKGGIITVVIFIVFSLFMALGITWRLTEVREKVETALKLKQVR